MPSRFQFNIGEKPKGNILKQRNELCLLSKLFLDSRYTFLKQFFQNTIKVSSPSLLSLLFSLVIKIFVRAWPKKVFVFFFLMCTFRGQTRIEMTLNVLFVLTELDYANDLLGNIHLRRYSAIFIWMILNWFLLGYISDLLSERIKLLGTRHTFLWI